MANIVTVANVQGYLDEQNTAWLSAEDVARGFGFTESKNGVEYVMWRRVNDYLASFGYFGTSAENSQRVGKGDYLPENMVYRLGFKANNETAVRFQSILADEVLPSIRKTGQYAVKPLTQGQMLVQMAQAYEAQERMLLEQQEKQRVMETQIHRLECATDVNYGFMAVLGYAKLHGIAVTRKLAATIGKAVSKYCRDNNIKFGSQKHPIFGNVNIYPDHALQAVFPKFFPNRSF